MWPVLIKGEIKKKRFEECAQLITNKADIGQIMSPRLQRGINLICTCVRIVPFNMLKSLTKER